MDNIAKFCIRHKVTTLMAVIMISIFGVVFTTRLQLALLPDMEAPAAMVVCYFNGATPSDMEELVTRPLESAIMSVSGVDGVRSTSSDGVSQVQITYVEGTNLDIAATKLREQFDRLSLPDGAMDPIIININIGDLMPSAMIALRGEDLADLQTLAEDTVAPASPSRSPWRWTPPGPPASACPTPTLPRFSRRRTCSTQGAICATAPRPSPSPPTPSSGRWRTWPT